MTGMYIYRVPSTEQDIAKEMGLTHIGSGRWAKKWFNTSGVPSQLKKQEADRTFGIGQWQSNK